MLGYFNDEEKTRAAFSGDWFHSGDLATIDEEGYISVVDRKKDMIKSGGENVASREVEEMIYRLAQVSEVAVIGLPEDQPWAQDILRMCDHPLCHSLVGYTRSLQELLMLFHHCDVLVTNDGGPGHFASLTPIRTLMFFGPETSRLYGPLTPRATVIELGLPCSPCLSAYNHRDTPCNGDNQCLKQIDVAQVLRLTQTQLALAASPGA
jgi:ADP-heptose:LPS heptosyltransferase